MGIASRYKTGPRLDTYTVNLLTNHTTPTPAVGPQLLAVRAQPRPLWVFTLIPRTILPISTRYTYVDAIVGAPPTSASESHSVSMPTGHASPPALFHT